jgi:hypothetical protein
MRVDIEHGRADKGVVAEMHEAILDLIRITGATDLWSALSVVRDID